MATSIKINIHSETWQAINEWAKGEISSLRERNDMKALDIVKTSVLRGEIRALKKLLNLSESKP